MNRKRNAFTLVELLTVVVILAIILIIAVPGVLSIINKTKNNAYESQLKIIKEAAKNYVMEARDVVIWKENQTVISLNDIQARGLLDHKLLDPRNRKELKHISVVITKSDQHLTYEIVYSDPSEASYPRLSSNMIPIVYQENKWVKADSTNESQSWFDYTKQQWANVATVTEDVRKTLLDAPVGTEVKMDDINAMFVWIPRYKYKLWNVDGSIEPAGNSNLAGDLMIDVCFETASTTKSSGTQNGEWLTHPAFTFGEEELEGFWVAKFETGFADSQGNADYVGNATLENIVDASKVVIKPTVTTWRYSTLSNFYKTSRQMSTIGNPFGLSEETQSHMAKNMEWGAMAYLSSSRYGKTGDPKYIGNLREVTTNQTVITGHGNKDAGTYETSGGLAASTTGNISGIYDTNGGGFEYVMAVAYDQNAHEFLLRQSGFTQEELYTLWEQNQFLDVYPGIYDNTPNNYSMLKLGDAMLEMGPMVYSASEQRYLQVSWYRDNSTSFNTQNTWLARGGAWDYGSLAGVFSFGAYAGAETGYHGSRIVLI